MSRPTRREVVTCGAAAAAAAALPAVSLATVRSPCSDIGPLLIGAKPERVWTDLTRLDVFSVHDLPPCFSRPIVRYMTNLNEIVPAALRPRLRSYAVHLPGTADTVEIERRRAEYLALDTVRVVAACALRCAGYDDHAHACATAPDCRAAAKAAVIAQHRIGHDRRVRGDKRRRGYGCAAQAANACCTATAAEFRWVPDVADRTAQALTALRGDLMAAGRDPTAEGMWDNAFAALDGLLAIRSGLSPEASCAAGRAAMVVADYDVPCWAHEQGEAGPRVRSRLLVKTCATCGGSGAEWVDKRELDECTLDFLADSARRSEDGRKIAIRCTACSGDGRQGEPDAALAAWWKKTKASRQET